jgi:sulfate permease, SulP family
LSTPVEASVARWLPILQWAPRYNRRDAFGDLRGGLTVWAVVTPQAIAYASLAGAPPEAGFYAALAAAIGYALFGTSRHLSVGPSSTPAVVAASLVAAAGVVSQDVAVTLAALALSTGIFLIAGGVLRLGFIADFLSRPVLVGFISGVAIDVIVGQLPALLGVPKGVGDTLERGYHLVGELDNVLLVNVVVSLTAIVALVLLGWLTPKLPGALIVVVVSIVVSRALDLSAHGVAVLSDLPSTLPVPGLPIAGFGSLSLSVGGGAALALVCYAESIGTAQTLARQHGDQVRPDQELIALGAGNVLCGVLQGFPTDASLSRSSVTARAAVKTPAHGLFTAFLLLVTILVLSPLFDGLPSPVVAAVIVTSIARLIDIRGFRRLYRIDRNRDFVLALVALLGVLTTGALGGLAIAVLASLLVLVIRSYRPEVVELGRAETVGADEDVVYRSIRQHPEYVVTPGVLVVRFAGQLFFANARRLASFVTERCADDASIATVVLDAAAIPTVDTSAADELGEMVTALRANGVEVVLARSTERLVGYLERMRPAGLDPPLTRYPTIAAAVAAVHPTP